MKRAQLTLAAKGEDIFADLLYYIRNGGSANVIAERYDITLGDLLGWVRDDPTRNNKYIEATEDRQEWAREAVLAEMKALALVRAHHVFNDDGTIKPPSEWPPEMAQTIQQLETSESRCPCPGCGEKIPVTIKKLKFWDKVKALEMMGKNLQLLNVKIDMQHDVTIEDLIQQTQVIVHDVEGIPRSTGETTDADTKAAGLLDG